jgi:hypothetical protein
MRRSTFFAAFAALLAAGLWHLPATAQRTAPTRPPGVGIDKVHDPALPCAVGLVLGCCLVPGVDQLLDGAAAEEAAGPALGGQDVGAAPDAELRCSRPGWLRGIDPLIAASLLAASSAQGMSDEGSQRSLCQRALTRNQGGRMSSSTPGVVRLAAARRPRNEARASRPPGRPGLAAVPVRGPGLRPAVRTRSCSPGGSRGTGAPGCGGAPARGKALTWRCRCPGWKARRAGQASAGGGHRPAAAGSRRRTGRSRRPGVPTLPGCAGRSRRP